MPPNLFPSGSSKTCPHCGESVDAAYLTTHSRKIHNREPSADPPVKLALAAPLPPINPPSRYNPFGSRKSRKKLNKLPPKSVPKGLTKCQLCGWVMKPSTLEAHAAYRHGVAPEPSSYNYLVQVRSRRPTNRTMMRAAGHALPERRDVVAGNCNRLGPGLGQD